MAWRNMQIKSVFWMLGWLCGLTLLGGCARHSSAGHKTGPRVVSTVPAATQILLQIGAAKTIVGVSPWDKPLLPQSMRNLPVVGNYLHLDEELVLQLAPTALLLQESPDRIPGGIVAMARNNGIHIVNVHLTTFHQLYRTTMVLGKISGFEKRAGIKIQALKAQLERLAAGRPQKPPRVVYIIAVNPVRVVGADNFMDEEVTLAGGVNVAQRCGEGFPVITRETLVQLDPQVLLIAAPGQPAVTGPGDPRVASWFTLPIAAAYSRHIDLITWRRAQMLTLQVGSIIKRLRKIIEYSGFDRSVLK